MVKISGLVSFVKKNFIRCTRRKARFIAVVFTASLMLIFLRINSYTENVNKSLSENLIRLHVVANSDSPEDQQLKCDVRDKLLAYVQNEVKDSESIEQTRAIVCEKMPDITAIAKETVLSYGRSYDVETSLGIYPFPTKVYGDITLPAGNYQALKVVIGDGGGANWWCVLFPPLCFVDVTHGVVPDSVKNDLKEVLSEEEYSIVTSTDNESDIPVKIKFKIVELFQDSRIKLAGVFNKLFNSEG